MKYNNEKTIEELKKKRRTVIIFDIVLIIIGTFYLSSSMYIYFKTGIIGLPVMGFITGSILLLLSAMPDNISLLIYLKEHEVKL